MSSYKAFPRFIGANSVISSFLLPVGIIFFLSVLSVGYLWISNEHQKLDEENQRYADEYLKNQKAVLRSEVERVKAALLREKAKAETELENTLRARVQDAHRIASGIYARNKEQFSDEIIKQMIVSALSELRVSNGRGYYFINSLNGVQHLYPPNPSKEGKHAREIFSEQGQAVVEMIVGVAREKNEGFVSYTWPRPGYNDAMNHRKYSYVKLFEPYGWILGTGDYLDAVENDIQERVFRQISEVTYGLNDEGYFFINSYKGDLYVTNGKYFGGERNIWNVEDARGTKVVQENARLAQIHPEGAFSRYIWKKNDGSEGEKIAFVLGMDEWNIFIGTGAYLDTMQKEITRREAALNAQVRNRIASALSVLVIALVVVVLAMLLIARKLSRNLQLFQNSFERSVDTRIRIDTDALYFNEFKQLASSANHMIDGLNAQAEELRHRVFHDHLTSLPNRLHGASHLEYMIERSLNSNDIIALLFIDLDNFKEINDSLGHSAGDELLQQVSLRLQEAVRDEDKVARLGGDEFTVITGLLGKRSDAEVIANKILQVFRQPFVLEDTELHVTASVGISLFPDDGSDAEILLRNADSAMYEAKRDGRNGYRFYTPDMTIEVCERVLMTDELREAIDQQQFELHYQPQICLTTGEVIGAEALVRWRHPEKGLIPPNKFIPYAESSGQIAQIGEWVLTEACSRMAQWREQGFHLRKVAVNISNQQLRRQSLVAMVQAALDKTDCDPLALELEITESTLMENPDEMGEELAELKALGVSLAIDDFGTGYSSLSYLKQLPINKLKIDRSFIRDLHEDPNDRAITRAIIAMGRSLNLTVIAEGVEYASQLSFLANEECQQVQGFFYSKPLQETEFLAYLQEHKSRREEMAEWI